MPRSVFAAIVVLFGSLSFSQESKPAAPPQTPRQVILEVITTPDSSAAVEHHLPEATKQYWKSRLKEISEYLQVSILQTMVGVDEDGVMIKKPVPNPNFETFEAGPILVRARDPRSGSTADLRIDSEDFSNDKDTMELSFKVNKQYVESRTPMLPPDLRISMKLENDVWRFEEIDITSKLPLGDPIYVKESLRQDAEVAQLFARDAVHEVVVAETDYLKQNGGAAFNCSEAELIPANDKSSAGRSSYPFDYLNERGYKIQLSDCTATSFHASAIPQQSGQPFFCADQSGAIRKSNKGIADCFAAGEPVHDDNAVQLSPQ